MNNFHLILVSCWDYHLDILPRRLLVSKLLKNVHNYTASPLLSLLLQPTWHDNGDFLDDDLKYKSVDDMSILEFLSLSGLLIDYDVYSHVPSDVGVDQMFSTQSYLDNISQWTTANLMKLNEAKFSYMIFTRMIQDYRCRLTLNQDVFDQLTRYTKHDFWD